VLQAGRSRIQIPGEVTGFFSSANPSSRTVTMGSTQGFLLGVKVAEHFTAICQPFV
jgi:hypothetical protein